VVGGQNQKLSLRGSVLANAMWGGCDMGGGDSLGYGGFEVVSVCDQMWHEGGGLVRAKNKNRASGAQFWLTQCGGDVI
jgi:hypothetical protein